MIENVEINYGTACEILSDENSDKKQLRLARATIASFAEQGHREAIAKVLSRPEDYDLDLEKAIDSLPDVKERAYMFNRLCDYYNGRDRGKLNRYALKSLENGKIAYIDANKPEIVMPMLEKLEPNEYKLDDIINSMKCYKKLDLTDNKWSACFFDKVESDPKLCFTVRSLWWPHRFMNFNQTRKFEETLRNYLSKNGIEDLSCSELENIWYFMEDGHLPDFSKIVGIKLLSMGKDNYLKSLEVAEQLVGYGSEIVDKELFKELEKASSKVKIYTCLASNYYITEKGRISFA